MDGQPSVAGPVLQIRVFGRLEVSVGGRAAALGTPKQRLLLALLLARANRAVPVAQLIDVLWDGDAPASARKSIQVYVSGLRRLVGDRISFGDGGYTCRIEAQESDLERFGQLAAAGRRAVRAGDRESAATALGDALRLWRGRPFAEFTRLEWFDAESKRLQARFLNAYEDWAELEIELGRHVALLETLDELAARHLDRERLSACRMTALARCGRTGEALAHYDRLRQLLAREFGIEPSPVLGELYRTLLTTGRPASHGAGTGGAQGARHGAHTYQGADHGPQEPPGVHQLPRKLADFTGRSAELDQILRGGTDLTVISGHCGTGKTTLAVQAGHLLHDAYPDGELFLRLRAADGRPVPPAEAVRDALRHTRHSWLLPQDGQNPLPAWRSWLSERRMVLIADDAPDEECVDSLLPGSGSCRVLVTAHRSLGALHCVQRIRLDEFGRGEAFTLLGRILGPARVHGAQATVLRLLDVFGASPRAVRLLGNKLASLPHVPIADFANRVEVMDDPCDALSDGGGSPRAEYERWLRGLPDLYRAALTRLTLLPTGGFGYEDAVRVLADLEAEPDRLVDAMLEENILSAPNFEVSLHAVMFEIPRPVRLAHAPGTPSLVR